MTEKEFFVKRQVSRLLAGGTANRVVGTTDGSAMTMLQIVNAMVSSSAAIDPLKFTGVAYVACTDNTNQSVAHNTLTDITWNTETEDAFGIHAAGSQYFTIPTGYGGIWVAGVLTTFAAGGTGNRQIQIHNAPVSIAGASAMPPVSAAATQGCVAVFRANAGNQVRAVAYQDSGGALNLIGATSTMYFFMARIGG